MIEWLKKLFWYTPQCQCSLCKYVRGESITINNHTYRQKGLDGTKQEDEVVEKIVK